MRKNWKVINVEEELKMIKAKEKASALMDAEEAKHYHLGMFSNGTKTTIKYIMLCIFSLLFGILFAAIFYNAFDNIAAKNMKDASNYMFGILPYTFGLFQIVLMLWRGKIGFILKSFGVGFLGTYIIYLFDAIKMFLMKNVDYNSFTVAMNMIKTNTELYSYAIILIMVYFTVLFINIALGIKQILNDT